MTDSSKDIGDNRDRTIKRLEAENAALWEIVELVAALMGGPLDTAELHIEHAREVNRKERPFSERLEHELIDARSHIREMQEQARDVRNRYKHR